MDYRQKYIRERVSHNTRRRRLLVVHVCEKGDLAQFFRPAVLEVRTSGRQGIF